jgi:hypothetical protein
VVFGLAALFPVVQEAFNAERLGELVQIGLGGLQE